MSRPVSTATMVTNLDLPPCGKARTASLTSPASNSTETRRRSLPPDARRAFVSRCSRSRRIASERHWSSFTLRYNLSFTRSASSRAYTRRAPDEQCLTHSGAPKQKSHFTATFNAASKNGYRQRARDDAHLAAYALGRVLRHPPRFLVLLQRLRWADGAADRVVAVLAVDGGIALRRPALRRTVFEFSTVVTSIWPQCHTAQAISQYLHPVHSCGSNTITSVSG